MQCTHSTLLSIPSLLCNGDGLGQGAHDLCGLLVQFIPSAL
jgi:hypothetical protein